MSDLRALYEQVILDHNRHPRNFQKNPAGSNHHAHGFNPVCGDEFHVHLRMAGGVIQDIGFEGAGCAISTASASLMTEALKGKSEQQAEALFENVHNLLMRQGPPGDVGKLKVLAGVHDHPARVKCASLPWRTLRAALHDEHATVCTE